MDLSWEVESAAVFLLYALAARGWWVTLWLFIKTAYGIIGTLVSITKTPGAWFEHWLTILVLDLVGLAVTYVSVSMPSIEEAGSKYFILLQSRLLTITIVRNKVFYMWEFYALVSGNTDATAKSNTIQVLRKRDLAKLVWANDVIHYLREGSRKYKTVKYTTVSSLPSNNQRMKREIMVPDGEDTGAASLAYHDYKIGNLSRLPDALSGVLQRCRTMNKNFSLYEDRGVGFSHTFVLVGPPGTGKTHAVFVLASIMNLVVSFLTPDEAGLEALLIARRNVDNFRAAESNRREYPTRAEVAEMFSSREKFNEAYSTELGGKVERKSGKSGRWGDFIRHRGDALMAGYPAHLYLFDDLDRFFSDDVPAEVRVERANILQEILSGSHTPKGFIFITLNDLGVLQRLGPAINRKGRAGDVYHITPETVGKEVLLSILDTFFFGQERTPQQEAFLVDRFRGKTAADIRHEVGLHSTYDELCEALQNT